MEWDLFSPFICVLNSCSPIPQARTIECAPFQKQRVWESFRAFPSYGEDYILLPDRALDLRLILPVSGNRYRASEREM